MSNANTVSNGQHRLAFGDGIIMEEMIDHNDRERINAAHAYVVPNHSGWLVYTRFNSCRAQLKASEGWTSEQAEVVARILDGDIVL